MVLFYQNGAADATRIMGLLSAVQSKFLYTGIAFNSMACADPIACGEAISVASGSQPEAQTPQRNLAIHMCSRVKV